MLTAEPAKKISLPFNKIVNAEIKAQEPQDRFALNFDEELGEPLECS